jgi:hypothetical protein
MEAHHKIEVTITGIRPLLQNAFVQNSSNTANTVKKGQSYDDLEEAHKRLITDSDGRICQPAMHLEGCLVKAATEFKFQGKKTYKDLN